MEVQGGYHRSRQGFDTSRPVRSFIEVVRSVFVEPARFFAGLRASHEEARGAPLLFAGICFAIVLPLSHLVAPLDPLASEIAARNNARAGSVGVVVAFFVVLAPILAVLCVYLSAFVQHLFVLLFIGDLGSFRATFLVVAYGSALTLLSWVPVLGYLLGLYGIYVVTVGLREMHGTTTIRALLATLVPSLIGLAGLIYTLF